LVYSFRQSRYLTETTNAMKAAEIRSILSDRLGTLEQRIQAACRQGGRSRADVTLIAVTKTVGAGVAALLPELGVIDLGESRPQELWRKAAALPKDVRWHLVGHLQRNKIEHTLPITHLIHSVDSDRLLDALEREAAGRRDVAVLLEVNMSGEAAKHGFDAAAGLALAPKIQSLNQVSARGLMTMAALSENPEAARVAFRRLRQLRDQMRQLLGDPVSLPHLSMGMTNDFEVAIEEGATLIRIGTALFEGLAEPQP
jgi:pyridoxal phosphate enzyme (YggS family)